ncbi:hypothetical protein PENTCL1PPCAC_1691, partial [Pristionchus entomophagus]
SPVTPKPVELDKLYENRRYVVPVNVPYKIRMPSRDTIDLGLKDAFVSWKGNSLVSPPPPPLTGRGVAILESSRASGSYLWSKKDNNNNIILAIHHEQPFELEFHLKSLPDAKPVPSPATVAPVPGPPATTQAPAPAPNA